MTCNSRASAKEIFKIGVICYPSLGGSGIVATELGHQLALQGHQVHFITYEIPFRLRGEEKNIHFHRVELNRYDLFKYPDYPLPLAVKIASVAKQYELDILHAHYAIPHATSAYLAKKIIAPKKPALVTTLHGTDITLVGKDPAYFEIVKFSIEQSDGVTAVSNHLKKETEKYFGVQNPIKVIHNYFTPRKELIGKKPPTEQRQERLIIHSSNFRDIKQPEKVIKIFIKIAQEIPAKLLLLGSGPRLESVKKMVADNAIENRVIFLGENPDIDPFIAEADLLLLPSSHESFGMAALEAMAYGVPVVASLVGGLPEVIETGKSGYLIEKGDIEQMAAISRKLLQDDALYDRISRHAMKRAAEKFCPTKILPQYLKVYRRAMRRCFS